MSEIDLTQFENATPGPWRVDGPPWNQIVWRTGENRVCFLAHTNGLDDARDIATGRLIAAAPDLLAEVKRLRDDRDLYVTRALREQARAEAAEKKLAAIHARREKMIARPFICEECSTDKIDCPMIVDEIWLQHATEESVLCLSCFERRLGREISVDDLRPCPWSASIKILVGRADRRAVEAAETMRERAAQRAVEIAIVMADGYKENHCPQCRDGENGILKTMRHTEASIRALPVEGE